MGINRIELSNGDVDGGHWCGDPMGPPNPQTTINDSQKWALGKTIMVIFD